jgi:hypothetical protein
LSALQIALHKRQRLSHFRFHCGSLLATTDRNQQHRGARARTAGTNEIPMHWHDVANEGSPSIVGRWRIKLFRATGCRQWNLPAR